MIYITAERLCDDYDENEMSADDIYKGKILEVSGKVKQIDRVPFTGAAYLTLDCGLIPYIDRVWCYFNKADESLLMQINIGDLVTVRGEGAGANLLGKPKLVHCTSVQFID